MGGRGGAWAGLETEWMLVLEHESRQIHRQRLARGTLSETVESGVHADSAERMCAHESLVLCVDTPAAAAVPVYVFGFERVCAHGAPFV